MEFLELLSPVGVKDGVLTCRVMELGAPDTSGRRSPVATGKTRTVPASAVIAAVGEQDVYNRQPMASPSSSRT